MIWLDLFGISGEDAEQAHFDFFFYSVREAISAYIPKYRFGFACILGQSGITFRSIEVFLCVKMSLLLSIVSYYL